MFMIRFLFKNIILLINYKKIRVSKRCSESVNTFLLINFVNLSYLNILKEILPYYKYNTYKWIY
jgi:hypothetical protein